jgi:hypothetical protein
MLNGTRSHVTAAGQTLLRTCYFRCHSTCTLNADLSSNNFVNILYFEQLNYKKFNFDIIFILHMIKIFPVFVLKSFLLKAF